MTDDPSLIKSLASLRHLLPTLWYYAFDAKTLVKGLREQTYAGLTKPWAYVGATTFLYGAVHSKLELRHPDLQKKHAFNFSTPELLETWLLLVLPFMLLFYINYTSKFKDAPSFRSTVALWLYIFGAMVLFVLTLGEVAMLSTGKPLNDLPLHWMLLGNLAAWWFFFGRALWNLAELHRVSIAEDENAFDNLVWGALGSFGAAFLMWWIVLIALDYLHLRPRDGFAWLLSLF